MRAWRQMLGLCACLSVLPSCSTFQFAYDHADWYLRRTVQGYTCPTAKQRAVLARELAALMRWHRSSEVPRYARDVMWLGARLASPAKRVSMDDMISVVRGWWRRLARRLVRPVGRYVAALGPKQVRCFLTSMDRVNNAAEQQLKNDPDDYFHDRADATAGRLEFALGTLSETQRQFVAVGRDGLEDERTFLQFRRRALSLAADVLRDRDRVRQLRRLRRVLTEPYEAYHHDDRPHVQRRVGRIVARLARVLDTLTWPQRQHFRDKLVTFATDLLVVARR